MKRILPLLACLLVAGSLPQVSAITVDPQYDQFGTLATTFGGSGIPNTSVAITTDGAMTLGLSAAARYDNPTVTDNGAGTFYALAGNDAAHAQPGYALWNFNFSITGVAQGSSVRLYYDANPAVGNDVSSYFFLPFTFDFTNSWNLGMPFLGGGFDPTVAGEYDFALVALNSDGNEFARSAITVNVSSVPDQSATIGLLGAAALGLVALRRRNAK